MRALFSAVLTPLSGALLLMISHTLLAANPILIGMNYPATGRYKEQGFAQANGALLAVDEINQAGGVLGRPLQLKLADTGSDPAKAVANVKALAADGVSVLMGGASTPVAIAAGKEAARHQLIYFGAVTAANQTTTEEGQRYMFRQYYNAWMIGEALASYLNTEFAGKRIFYLTADYAAGTSTEDSLRQLTHSTDRSQHPGVLVRYPNPRRSDFTDALKQAADAHPDVLVVIQFGSDLSTALGMIRSQGLAKTMQVVTPAVNLDVARQIGAAALQGVVSTVPWYWHVPYQYGYVRGQAFVEAYRQRYAMMPSNSAATGYDIVYQFADAARRAGTLDSEALIRALEGHRYQLLKDEQSWRAFDHQNVQTVYLVRGRNRDDVMTEKSKAHFFDVIGALSGEQTVQSYEVWADARKKAGQPLALQ
ncbi:ABC transporter substrate-binding protein [Thalassolituus sp. LLYu03]|uniref:ABC transporter substrate-binding protein n=1 Tax=Thalassolituus sp. LLYu03 TaxID=3421656 RepID=UPI003D2B36EF